MPVRIFLIFFGFFFFQFSGAQDFSSTIVSSETQIDGKLRKGYATSFGFVAKDVEKGWWRYSREFGRPLNMRGYYKVTIPSTINSGNVDLELLSKVSANKQKTGSQFFLCLNAEKVPKGLTGDYNEQLKTILLDFKQYYYIEWLEDQLEDLEKQAKKAGKRVARANEKNKDRLIDELELIQEKIEKVKGSLKIIYSAF